MIRMKNALAIVVALFIGFGLAACGSDSDSGSDQGGSSDGSASIEGVTWELMNVGSVSQGWATSLPNKVEKPTLEFSDGRVQVFTGCNTGSGDVEINEATIDFGPIGLTRKSCGKLANQTEQFVAPVLEGQVKYEFQQGNLVLTGKDISLVLTKAEQ
ncbi:MAG: META domain-containing protein [Solirubrobacterales bacterium]|nr:META domain-containing protein [Solirubrobacterales bacterium]